MSKTEIPEDIAALARKVGKQFKSEQDLADFSRLLKKMAVEAALGAELDEHLGYAKHEARGRSTGNSRNGYSSKTLKGAHGEVELETPRDRNGTFEPRLIRKGQTRLTQFDDQILALYAKGMSTRDIVATPVSAESMIRSGMNPRAACFRTCSNVPFNETIARNVHFSTQVLMRRRFTSYMYSLDLHHISYA